MYATGMKIEEWEDGQVNIGIAVCPKPPANIGTGKDTLSSNAKPIVPNSAFVIQPPASHQSQGVSITYAHQAGGISDLIIMLSPQDQGQPDKLSELSRLQNRISNMSITQNGAPLNSPVSVEVTGPSPESIEEEKKQPAEHCFDEQEKVSGESNSVKSPQEEVDDKVAITSKTGTPRNTSRNSSEMKRVSWVEEAEVFEVCKGRVNSKENKRQSGRKAVGLNGNRSPSKSKKQNAFTRDALEGSSVGEQQSGDKSRIPVIGSNAINGDYPHSCEYYRRKMLQELYTAPADNWYGYQSLQRYAGQKVVKKIAAEQKRLEEDISSRRKTEIWILGNDTEDFMMSPPSVPLRKKTTRLKPMQIVH
ncbi:unnamed protein product [Orchesella dallaii]|uniref:Uncharacterized protein n=1 Tax=Orchesella dallaii TaxID=48710 RepID=A0ABP1Q4H3_9HEXA